MKYNIEEWQSWEYPSNWSYVESFKDLNEAKIELDRLRANNPKISFRLIQIIDEGD